MVNRKYTNDELIRQWKHAYVQLKKAPSVSQFPQLGLPDIGFYNRMTIKGEKVKNYSNFQLLMGIPASKVPPVKYKKKINPKRFFLPKEWIQFMNTILNQDHRFWFEFLLHTGVRFEEAKGIQVEDIDFSRKSITILHAKGGKNKIRTIMVSTYLINRIQQWIQKKKLTSSSQLDFPSNPFMNQAIKHYAKKSGITDWEDLSCHNLRKTLENYGCALNVSPMVLTSFLGHLISTAQFFYVASTGFTQEEKVLIRSILDDLWLNIPTMNQVGNTI